MAKYEITIGLEIHVEIETNTKMFCGCKNEFGASPNTNVCPVCLGYPGVMPVPNQTAIEKIILTGMMINCDIPDYSKFDRKAYWYPDMAKNYQITQFDYPYCLNGRVPISGKSLQGDVESRNVKVNRIHLEEDVAKSSHGPDGTGIDFNRAGVPLMEIVSEPDIHSADEAYAYLQALKEIVQYANVSECSMEKGQMRCDVNISLRPIGQKELNTKTEIKNLNSLKAIHRSIDYEIERQIEMLEDEIPFRQQTRGWNDERGETYVMRDKENSDDYRYFPEPDLMPTVLTDELRNMIKEKMPETPQQRRTRLVNEYKIPAYNAQIICAERELADWYESLLTFKVDPKKASNWIMGDLLRELSEAGKSITTSPVSPESFSKLLLLIDKGIINGKIAKQVFSEMFSTQKEAETIVKERGLEQVSDASAILAFVRQAISENPKAVEEYKAGSQKIIGFFVGQVMKLSRGKANPQQVNQMLRDELT